MGPPRAFIYFRSFHSKNTIFTSIQCEKWHTVNGTGIWTHDLSNMGHLPKPLDQGSRSSISFFLCLIFVLFAFFCFCIQVLLFLDFPFIFVWERNSLSIFCNSQNKVEYYWSSKHCTCVRVFTYMWERVTYMWEGENMYLHEWKNECVEVRVRSYREKSMYRVREWDR